MIDNPCHRLNVARLANIPDSVLQLAAVKSKALEDLADEKNLENMYVRPLVKSDS
jgi:DNA mismatch repair ATPase MutS